MSTTTRSAAAVVGANRKFLSVSLAGEGYCLPLTQVREIIRYQKVTPVPRLSEHIRGVINLRGRIIPVIDLRTQLGLPSELADRTCIVVAAVPVTADRFTPMGLIVDSVEEVSTVTSQDVDEMPPLGSQIRTEYLLGVAKTKGAVRMLLNLERLFGASTLAAADAAQAA